MDHARSGELSVELGHDEPNAPKAPCERQTLWADEPALAPCVKGSTPLRLVGPRTVAIFFTDEPEGFARPLPARRAELELGHGQGLAPRPSPSP